MNNEYNPYERPNIVELYVAKASGITKLGAGEATVDFRGFFRLVILNIS